MTDLCVGEGVRVTLHFSLSLQDGSTIDSNFDGEAATFDVGDGNLLPAFEQCLHGMQVGERKNFQILPEQAFGRHNPGNIYELPRSEFPRELEMERGLVISFTNAAQVEIPGVVISCDEQTVKVDFNHPLAGRTILFEAEIIDLEPAVTH